MKRFSLFLFVAIIISALVVAGCSSSLPDDGSGAASGMSGTSVQIFKSSSCGCCDLYAQYIGKNNFDVEASNVMDIAQIKSQYGVPKSMESCHTTVVDGYFVEGHMPKEAIEKLLSEKPDIKGIAMPGMPSGSPGMPGGKQGPFIIYAVHTDGSTSEFMRI